MGGGSYSADVHEATMRSHRTEGTSFKHDADVRSGRAASRIHQSLDPMGLRVRESRDSEEHPDSNSIVCGLDVTGSMRQSPQTAIEKLPLLMTTLIERGIIPDPQVLFAAVGDAYSDTVPLQIGQFESDNRMAGDLNNMFLEGGGGSWGKESYELMLYTLARCMSMDCFEKRGKRGYAFLLGDELAYPRVSNRQVAKVFGHDIGQDMDLEDVLREALLKFDIYLIIPRDTSGGNNPEVFSFWQNLLPHGRVLRMDTMDAICETIATAIGINEQTLTLAQSLGHFEQKGSSRNVLTSLKRTFAI